MVKVKEMIDTIRQSRKKFNELIGIYEGRISKLEDKLTRVRQQQQSQSAKSSRKWTWMIFIIHRLIKIVFSFLSSNIQNYKHLSLIIIMSSKSTTMSIGNYIVEKIVGKRVRDASNPFTIQNLSNTRLSGSATPVIKTLGNQQNTSEMSRISC